MIDKLGGRKFVFACAVTLMGFVLVVVNKLTPDAWITFAKTVGAVYVIGNVGKAIVTKQ
jgi:hypothetical protein